MLSVNCDPGGHERDARQGVSDPGADAQGLVQVLLGTLGAPSHCSAELAQPVSQALALDTEEIEDERQKYEYESTPAQDRGDHNADPHTARADPQSPAVLEADRLCLPYPVGVSLQLPPNEAALEHTLHLQVSETAKALTVKVLFSLILWA